MAYFKQARKFYRGRIGGLGGINLAVVHCTQSPNPSASGVANYFAGPSAGGSTQWVFDDLIEVRCVRDEDTCWGAFSHNSNGLHYELCGYAEWSRDEWMQHLATIRKAAKQIASDMKRYGIPYRYPAPIINGRAQHGIHTHNGLPGNNHTDPMPGNTGAGEFPMDVLLLEIRKALGLAPVYRRRTRDKAIRSRIVKKREAVAVRIVRRNGEVLDGKGWSACVGYLNWIARNGHAKVDPKTTIEITWQGHRFSSGRLGLKHVCNVAKSIYANHAI